MKTASVIAVLAAASAATTSYVSAQDAAAAAATTFTPAEKALWIDRHNYFRMTALPFAAGNMLKIKWSDALATAAATDAADCDAATSTGMNVHLHSTGATSSLIDMAFQNWAVSAGLSALSKIKAPKAAGEPVGTGVYNSYSQLVWSATNQVGCGFAMCPAGKLVVCKYAPAGNGANEPWYTHAPPNSQCPSGTEGKQGLCIVPGDAAATNAMAPIPAGQHAYDVFASFMGSMQAVLKGEKIVDGGPATGTNGASTNPGASAGASAGTMAPAPAAATPAPMNTEASGAISTTFAPSATATATAGSNAADPAAPSAASASLLTPTGAPTTNNTASIGFGAIESSTDAATTADVAPGHVRASESTGTTFTNAATASPADKTVAAPSAQDAQSTTTDDNESSGGAGTANNKSSSADGSGARMSAAGVAGAVVIGCVMVAGVFVFVSYRKNQRRQRDIMQNGGIMLI